MKLKIILSLSIIALFLSCHSQKKETIPTPIRDLKIEDLRLNNTKLWLSNSETTSGILKMQEIMRSFSPGNNTKDYTSLKNKLEIEFTTIFQKCTMKGEAHNQLHNYLKPMIPIFDSLESSDLKICKENFKKMNRHLAGYTSYFK